MSVFRCALVAMLATAVAAALPGTSRAALIIDNYNVGAQSLTTTAGPITGSAGPGLAPNVIGGTRDLSLTAAPNQFGLNAKLEILTGPGILSLSNDVGVSSVGSAEYDAAGAGLASLDLLAAGNKFDLSLTAIDLTVSITIEVTDGSAVTSSRTLSGLTVGVASFTFASFVGGADFTDVEKIKVTFNAPNSADLSADYLQVDGPTNVVPEPASVALLATGLAGLVARRRRAAK